MLTDAGAERAGEPVADGAGRCVDDARRLGAVDRDRAEADAAEGELGRGVGDRGCVEVEAALGGAKVTSM